MSGAVLLVVLLGLAVASVGLLAFIEWLHGVRQAKAAGRAAQAVIAEMGRHTLPASEERTDPKYREARALLPIGDEPVKRPRPIPVDLILERVEREGYAVRLNWRRDDERRAKHGEGGSDPGDFPTAVLPRIEG
jgi:hypothetical protein